MYSIRGNAFRPIYLGQMFSSRPNLFIWPKTPLGPAQTYIWKMGLWIVSLRKITEYNLGQLIYLARQANWKQKWFNIEIFWARQTILIWLKHPSLSNCTAVLAWGHFNGIRNIMEDQYPPIYYHIILKSYLARKRRLADGDTKRKLAGTQTDTLT